MDAIDRRILNMLRDHARATYQELGDAIGLSAPGAHQRVKKLEETGVITGYHAAVNAAETGLPLTAILMVTPPPGVAADHPSWRTAPAFVAGFQMVDGDIVLIGNFGGLGDLADHVDALRTAGCQVESRITRSTAFTRGNPLGT